MKAMKILMIFTIPFHNKGHEGLLMILKIAH